MNHTVSFRVNNTIFRQLKTLSQIWMLSVSECLRRLILQEYIRQDLNYLARDGIPSHPEWEQFRREYNKIYQKE